MKGQCFVGSLPQDIALSEIFCSKTGRGFDFQVAELPWVLWERSGTQVLSIRNGERHCQADNPVDLHEMTAYSYS